MAKSNAPQTKIAFDSLLNLFDYADQQKTLRKAVRKESKTVLKIAKEYVRTTKAGKKKRSLSEATTGIEEGLHEWVYPDKGGTSLIVTPVPHKKKGYHLNRYGLEKPVLMWAEGGTVERHRGPKLRGSTEYRSRLTGRKARRYYRMGASTGQMPKYEFIEKAENAAFSGSEARIFENFEKSMERKARKEGLL